MDPLPPTLLRPEPEIMIAGFPMRQIMRHHSPGSPRAKDVKDAIEDFPLCMDLWSATQGEGRGWQERFEDFPLDFSQTGRILTHPASLAYLSSLVQINCQNQLFLRQPLSHEMPFPKLLFHRLSDAVGQ